MRAGQNIFSNFFFGTQPNVEFHPGPDMYVNGTVYIGGNLYTAQNSIHFLNDVTFTGQQYLNYRTNDPRYGNTAPHHHGSADQLEFERSSTRRLPAEASRCADDQPRSKLHGRSHLQ